MPAASPVAQPAVDPEVRAIEPEPPQLEAPENKETALPEPPDDPAQYRAWLDGLPRAGRLAIAKYCRAHPVDYTRHCNGIGPWHIPMPPPPSMMEMENHPTRDASVPEAPRETFEEWYTKLTRAQRAYHARYCDTEDYEWAFTDLCGGTPLVISFENQPIAYSHGAGQFAFQPGDPVATDWPTAATPWLALDRDGDGAITSGAELFGGNTVLPSGATAAHGFSALAPLDSNGDRLIDAADRDFGELLLWADRDGDRASAASELVPAAQVLVSISLDYRSDPQCDARRNCQREHSTVRWRDASGAIRAGSIIDIYLAYRR